MMIERKSAVITVFILLLVIGGMIIITFIARPHVRTSPDLSQFTIQNENGTLLFIYHGDSALDHSALRFLVDRGSGLKEESDRAELQGSSSWEAVLPGQTIRIPPGPNETSPLGAVIEFPVVPAMAESAGGSTRLVISKGFVTPWNVNRYAEVSPSPAPTASTGQLIPGFTSISTTPFAPQIVQFTDTSSGNPSEWFWDFGDGGNSILKNPVHLYQNPGEYTVALTVANGPTRLTLTRENAIVVREPEVRADRTKVYPILPFVNNNGNGTFTAYFGYNNENNEPVSIPVGELNAFSPEPASRGQPVVFEPGIHRNAVAVIFDGNALVWRINNRTAMASSVSVPVRVPPEANLMGFPQAGAAPLRVSFDDLSSGSPATWYWTFGDGNVSDEQNPTYIYAVPGNYTVSVTVTNAFGMDRMRKVEYITVLSAIQPDVSGVNRTGGSPEVPGTAGTPAPQISPVSTSVPTPAPLEKHALILSTSRFGFFKGGTSLSFRVTGNGSYFFIGGALYEPQKGDMVQLRINSGQEGWLEMTTQGISRSEFSDVTLLINGEEKASGPISSVRITELDDLVSSLGVVVPPALAWTDLSIDGSIMIYGINGTPILISDLVPDTVQKILSIDLRNGNTFLTGRGMYKFL